MEEYSTYRICLSFVGPNRAVCAERQEDTPPPGSAWPVARPEFQFTAAGQADDAKESEQHERRAMHNRQERADEIGKRCREQQEYD